MDWWRALSVDTGDTQSYQDYLVVGAAIFILTAMVIVFWRMLNGQARFAIAVVVLALFFWKFVLPNLGGS